MVKKNIKKIIKTRVYFLNFKRFIVFLFIKTRLFKTKNKIFLLNNSLITLKNLLGWPNIHKIKFFVNF